MDDFGKLILRISIGGLMLFHGYAKIHGGIGFIEDMLSKAHLPTILAYGVYIGEIITPGLILIGFLVRWSAIIYATNMFFSVILLSFSLKVFGLQPLPSGAWNIETNLLFFLGSLALIFLGGGKYSLDRRCVIND